MRITAHPIERILRLRHVHPVERLFARNVERDVEVVEVRAAEARRGVALV
jgi:hypothetical protein